MGSLWLEIDEDGQVLRRSEEVESLFASIDPPVVDLTRVLELRTDLRAAVGRKAGKVRFGLGRGAGRLTFDVDVGVGGQGAHLTLERVEALQDDAELGRLLVSHAEHHPDAVIVTDADGVILWCDPGFASMVGYDRGEVTGRHLRLFRSDRVGTREIDAYWRGLFATGIFSGQTFLRRSDGVDVPAQQSVSAIRDDVGRTTHYVALMRDVSRQREIERLRNIDLAVSLVARLCGDHAHTLNNVAAEVVAVCDQAMLSDDPASAGLALDRVQGLARRLGELGRQMLALSTSGAGGTGPADMGRVARDLAQVLEMASGESGPRVTISVPEAGPWVQVAPDALVRASIHLMLRSLDGVEGDVPIEIVAGTSYDEGVLRIRYHATTAERIALRWLLPDGGVTGPMGNELLTRAYGAGVMLDMEEERDGRISILIRAPLAEHTPAPLRAPVANAPGRWPRMLIAEDNEPLRELMATALESLFEEIVQVSDGAEAIASLEAAGGKFELVVLDLRMPEKNGMDVLVEIQQRWPGIRAIVASGAAPEGVAQTAIAAGALAVLQKPFKLNELRAVVRGVMAEALW